MEQVRHIAVEQTALANLLLRQVPDFLSSCYLPRVTATTAGRAQVLALPMATYNCIRVRPGTERMPDVSVVHFVGSKKKSWHWEAVSSLVRRSIGLTEPA